MSVLNYGDRTATASNEKVKLWEQYYTDLLTERECSIVDNKFKSEILKKIEDIENNERKLKMSNFDPITIITTIFFLYSNL